MGAGHGRGRRVWGDGGRVEGGRLGLRLRLPSLYARASLQSQAVERRSLAAHEAGWLSWCLAGWLHAFYTIVPSNGKRRRRCNQQGSKWLLLTRPFLCPPEIDEINLNETTDSLSSCCTGYEDASRQTSEKGRPTTLQRVV